MKYLLITLKYLFMILIIILSCLFFIYFYQRHLIYFSHHEAIKVPIYATSYFKVIKVETSDKVNLQAWYAPAKDNYPTIVYFHGNKGDIADRIPNVIPYITNGYGVLLVEYRGYTLNPGSPNEQGLYNDGRAAITFLHRQGIKNSCIILFGESLGTGVAVQLASEYPVAALILQSPYTSILNIGKYHYPYLPVKLLLKDQFNSFAKITRVHSPLLMIYAASDLVIPARDSEQLFNAANPPKFKFEFNNHYAIHNHLASKKLYEVVLNFLKNYRCLP